MRVRVRVRRVRVRVRVRRFRRVVGRRKEAVSSKK
jgi:hypothetical protein